MSEIFKINNNINQNFYDNRVNKTTDTSFQKILDNEIKEVKFSKHSIDRIKNRNLNLTENDYQKLVEAVNRAEQKGIKDSLIIINNKAFVVNLKSRTIVTAIDSQTLKNSIFTNIDGAVII